MNNKNIQFNYSQSEISNTVKKLWANMSLSTDCKRNLDNQFKIRLLYSEEWNLVETNKKWHYVFFFFYFTVHSILNFDSEMAKELIDT